MHKSVDSGQWTVVSETRDEPGSLDCQQHAVRQLSGVLVIAMAMMLEGASVSAQAPGQDEPAPTDWPTTISRLQQQLSQRPDHVPTRTQLAIAYNNYGVSLGDAGQWTLAARQLEEALRLDGANEQFRHNFARIRLSQAQEAYQRHQANEAVGLLDKALALDPRLAPAHALRGEIEYDRQQLKQAKAAWQRALELDPTQAEVSQRLNQVTQELPVESEFERLLQTSFDLRYEESLERPAGFDVRDALLEARRAVGSDFAYWPTYRLVVLIYSAEYFRALRRETPDWVAGQFDGKIRVPLPGAHLDPSVVKQIISHEYTHAVVQDLTKGRCPTWLNEGLGEYEGRRQMPGSLARLAAASQSQAMIPWKELSDWISTTRPAEEVGLAYEQSYSLVAYLIERYGLWRIRRLLKAITEGGSWQDVLSKEYRLKLARLEADWRTWLPEFLRRPR